MNTIMVILGLALCLFGMWFSTYAPEIDDVDVDDDVEKAIRELDEEED